MHAVTMPDHMNGPPASAHGGTAAGLFAEASGVPHPVVTLLAPPPMSVEITPHPSGGGVEYRLADRAIARVDEGPGVNPVGLPRLDATAVAAATARMRRTLEPIHPFPTCFGCGHARPNGDGLELVAGAVSEELYAAAWTPAPTGSAEVPEWLVWAAIDCPSGHACLAQIEPGEAIVLGRFAVRIMRRPAAGEDLQIVVRPGVREGRRIAAVASIVDRVGAEAAVGESTWVTIPM